MDVPKYISSFELEEARLGQALQKAKLESNNQFKLNQDQYSQILKVLKDQSVNVEFAIMTVLEKNKKNNEQLSELLENFLLAKK